MVSGPEIDIQIDMAKVVKSLTVFLQLKTVLKLSSFRYECLDIECQLRPEMYSIGGRGCSPLAAERMIARVPARAEKNDLKILKRLSFAIAKYFNSDLTDTFQIL